MEIGLSHLAELDPESLAMTLDFMARQIDSRIKTKKDKIDYICSLEKISISTFQRVFGMRFPDAQSIIERLINLKIIEPVKKGYHTLNHVALKNVLIKLPFLVNP